MLLVYLACMLFHRLPPALSLSLSLSECKCYSFVDQKKQTGIVIDIKSVV